MAFRKAYLIIFLLAACNACSNSHHAAPEPVSMIVGRWSGYLFQRGISYNFEMNCFRESSTRFVGDFELELTEFTGSLIGVIDADGNVNMQTFGSAGSIFMRTYDWGPEFILTRDGEMLGKWEALPMKGTWRARKL